ncbi:MAG: 50S ribosomal protein L19 [Hydrogenobaculum sp.]|jgi:large subunit ribosomal protein L19|uniref:50S ribosomal protein L19 n=1 Tax=unclassified Hydrogenobaculum TaxID=2622382 RepID=UPI0001C51EB9|nr:MULTISPECIES: 50S ribosomal protein L19 [unclassified Hydrogenobaculum]AEF19423.1 ribosomal protein L19 [Hydrogenobaculum sp. 3684]AEG46712.1 50S ribosomal protein L19 [Hydrogenobaculum sp. SHO]AGG15356.1 ribosomal protein L19 [Hydrogenobaculum sp. HO]AGH93658.1 ribosomal protein L19 [Hydrogenobaculum sp. SN]
MNIQELEKLYTPKKEYPKFKVGDTIRVNYKIKEGDKERIQGFEGIVIRIKNKGLNKMFTVRKESYGVGIERTFPYYSPNIDSIQLVKYGKVRRAKLYFLRQLKGKTAARKIKEIKSWEKEAHDKLKQEAKSKKS